MAIVRKTKLFVEAGPAISTIGDSEGPFSSTSVLYLVSSSSSNTISGGRDTRAGITAGGGIDVPVLHAHLRPEFSYSHWFQSVGAYAPSVGLEWFAVATTPFESEQNEASFLFGLSF